MKRLFILAGFVCLIAMASSTCAPQPEQPAEPVPETAPSTEADVAAIKLVVFDNWTAAMKAGDLDALMALYSDDAVRMEPNEPAKVGHQAIRAGYERDLEKNTYEPVSTLNDVVVFGDWAAVRGTDETTQTPKDGGEPSLNSADWMILLKRQPNGTWRILWEIWNSNTPAPGGQTNG